MLFSMCSEIESACGREGTQDSTSEMGGELLPQGLVRLGTEVPVCAEASLRLLPSCLRRVYNEIEKKQQRG